jgi:hypothetical protein
MQDVALNVPALTLAAFHPLIGKNSIVAFLVSPMASSSSVSSNTGGFHLVRAAFAGVGALIQTLALDFPDSLVFGVYPGSILPGRQLAGRETTKKEHSHFNLLTRCRSHQRRTGCVSELFQHNVQSRQNAPRQTAPVHNGYHSVLSHSKKSCGSCLDNCVASLTTRTELKGLSFVKQSPSEVVI